MTTALRQFVLLCADLGSRFDQFIIEHGVAYCGRRLPRRYSYGAERYCFMNAANLAIAQDDLTYVEGYGLISRLGIPMHHAWCIDAKGKVIDTTWRDIKVDYIGVPIPAKLLISELLRSKTYALLYDRHDRVNQRFIDRWKRSRQ